MIGFSTAAFRGSIVDRSIDFAIENGFPALEIAFTDEALFGGDSVLPTRRQARMVAGRCAGLRLSIHAPTGNVSLADANHRVRRQSEVAIRRTIAAASDMGADVVVCHLSRTRPPGNLPIGDDQPARLAAIEHLMSLADDMRGSGMVLALENKGRGVRAVDRDYRGLREVIDTVDSPNVSIAFDVGHANAKSLGPCDITGDLSLFSSRIVHWHFHDNDGVSDQHGPLGSGNIDFAPVVDCWARSGDRSGIIELSATVEGDIEAALLHSRAALIHLLGECGAGASQ